MTDHITLPRAVVDGALACLVEECIGDVFYAETVAALRAALAEPEPEPVEDPFADLRGKRMGELTAEQTDRANELCTWVIQYAKPSDVPRAHAHMAALGGQVVAVQFADALDALTKTEAERDALLALIVDDGFAASFQTMAQYRSALLNSVKGDSNG